MTSLLAAYVFIPKVSKNTAVTNESQRAEAETVETFVNFTKRNYNATIPPLSRRTNQDSSCLTNINTRTDGLNQNSGPDCFYQ